MKMITGGAFQGKTSYAVHNFGVLAENIKDGEKCGFDDVSYFVRFFKKQTGTTITEYKNTQKLAKAKRLLISTEKNITEISNECGFESSSYFAELFKSYENLTPTNYRDLLKK